MSLVAGTNSRQKHSQGRFQLRLTRWYRWTQRWKRREMRSRPSMSDRSCEGSTREKEAYLTSPQENSSEKALLGSSERLWNVKKKEVTGICKRREGAFRFLYGFGLYKLLLQLMLGQLPRKWNLNRFFLASIHASSGQLGYFTKMHAFLYVEGIFGEKER